MEWTWVCSIMPRWYGKTVDRLSPGDIIRIVRQWNEAVVSLDRMLYDDAHKEFSMISRIGFGVDGSSIDDIDASALISFYQSITRGRKKYIRTSHFKICPKSVTIFCWTIPSKLPTRSLSHSPFRRASSSTIRLSAYISFSSDNNLWAYPLPSGL